MRIAAAICLVITGILGASGTSLALLAETKEPAEQSILVMSFEECFSLGADSRIWPELKCPHRKAVEVISWDIIDSRAATQTPEAGISYRLQFNIDQAPVLSVHTFDMMLNLPQDQKSRPELFRLNGIELLGFGG